MQKSNLIQKKGRFVIPAIPAILILALIIQTSLENPHHFIIGPYKAFALSFLLSVFFLSLDFCFYQRSRSILYAWFFIFAGLILIGIFSISQYLIPGSNRLIGLGRWSFFAVIICLFGIGLRVNHFFPFRKSNIICSNQSVLIVLSILFLFLSFLPVLSSGFYWDDAFFATTIPVRRISGVSIWQDIKDEIISYSLRGRINPFATFQFLIFYLFPDVHAYKTILLILTLIDGCLFYKFNSELFKNQIVALAILLLLPLCIQLRIYHDPMLGYYGLMQMMFAELMVSLICFNRYLENRKKKYLVISIIFFTIGLMSYEMFFPLILLYFLMAWHSQKKWQQTLSLCAPFLLIEIILLAASFLLRYFSVKSGIEIYSGTTFSLNFGKILTTWRNQIMAAFPLNYWIAGDNAPLLDRLILSEEIFSQSFGAFLSKISWSDILTLLLSLFLCVEISKCIKLPNVSGFHWAFGLILLVASGFVISLSQKYQGQVIFGLGYLPVFFGYFAAAFLIFCLIVTLYHRLRKYASPDTLLIFGLSIYSVVFLLNQQTNRISVENMNKTFLYPRQTGESALHSGILNVINPREEVLVENNPFNLWEQEWSGVSLRDDFVLLHSGISMRVMGIEELKNQLWNPDKKEENFQVLDTWVLEYNGDSITGFAKLGKLIETGFDESGLLGNPVANNIRFFIRKGEKEPQIITWITWDGLGHYAKISDQRLIKKTSEGNLYQLADSHAILFDSIGLSEYQ